MWGDVRAFGEDCSTFLPRIACVSVQPKSTREYLQSRLSGAPVCIRSVMGFGRRSERRAHWWRRASRRCGSQWTLRRRLCSQRLLTCTATQRVTHAV